MLKEVTYYDIDSGSDEEITVSLPHKNEVCPRCEGHGTHLNPSIGNHAYTAEEFAESFDEEEAEEYCRRGGMYDVTCEVCKGRNVVPVIDLDACSETEKKIAEKVLAYREECDRQAAEDRRTRWYEDGCPQD